MAKLIAMEQINVQGKNQSNVFYEREVMLNGDGSKDRGFDWLGRRKKVTETLKQGSHQYPFQFMLPSHLPPSLETNEAKIRYIIEVTVESGNPKMTNLVAASLVKVSGSIFDLNFVGNNNNPFTHKENKTFFMTAKSLDIIVNLESKVFLPGDSMKIKFGLDNQTSKVVTKMTMSLIQKTEYYGTNGYVIDEKEDSLAVLPLGGLNGYEQKFPAQQLLIPTTACETLALTDVDGKKVGKLIRVSQYLSFYGEVGGLIGSEVKFVIPIFIVRTVKPQVTQTSFESAPSFTDYHPEQYQQVYTQQISQISQQIQPTTTTTNPPQVVYQTQPTQQYVQPIVQTVPTTVVEHQQLYPNLEIQSNVVKKTPPTIPNELKQPQYDEFF
jgi:hypothetical protein